MKSAAVASTPVAQHLEDVESPRTLNPSAFTWGSPDHYKECYGGSEWRISMGGYAVHLSPEIGVDLWMACEMLLPTPSNPLNGAILEDLLAMEEGARSAMLSRLRVQASAASSFDIGASHGPMHGDYQDAFSKAIATMPSGSFPATERRVAELLEEESRKKSAKPSAWNLSGSSEKSGEKGNGGSRRGDYSSENTYSLPTLTGEELAGETKRRLGEHLGGMLTQRHYYPMSSSYDVEKEGFLTARRTEVARLYLSNLLVATRQLSNLADIARLPFNREKGMWSSYLNNRIDPGEWEKMGYYSVENISSMAESLNDFMKQLLQAGERDPSVLLTLYGAQDYLCLTTLLALRDLSGEYNLEWALASIDWEAIVEEAHPRERGGVPRSTPLENALEMHSFYWIQ